MIRTINDQLDQIGPIDLVIVTGDLTDHGRTEEYAEFLRLVDGLSVALVAIPGCHDDRELMRAAFLVRPEMAETGPLNLRLDLDSIALLGLDFLVPGAPSGVLDHHTLNWLDEQLSDLTTPPVLLGLQNPPMETGIPLMVTKGLGMPKTFGRDWHDTSANVGSSLDMCTA